MFDERGNIEIRVCGKIERSATCSSISRRPLFFPINSLLRKKLCERIGRGLTAICRKLEREVVKLPSSRYPQPYFL